MNTVIALHPQALVWAFLSPSGSNWTQPHGTLQASVPPTRFCTTTQFIANLSSHLQMTSHHLHCWPLVPKPGSSLADALQHLLLLASTAPRQCCMSTRVRVCRPSAQTFLCPIPWPVKAESLVDCLKSLANHPPPVSRSLALSPLAAASLLFLHHMVPVLGSLSCWALCLDPLSPSIILKITFYNNYI